VTSEARSAKLFVVDTNVILHDAQCIRRFEENDIAIPIAVLEELDHFKKGNDDIHFQAREFLRTLDELTGDVLSERGAAIGTGHGSIRIVLADEPDRHLGNAFLQDTPDHRILSVALMLQQREVERPVVLVSKDTNLRLKAKSLGLTAQDYNNDKVESFDKLYTGKRFVTNLQDELFKHFSDNGGHVPAKLVPDILNPIANENFILRNNASSMLATYNGRDRKPFAL